MHRRVLIANRGEIAMRIMRTARLLGMECVAVHTVADRAAMHVREADRSVLLVEGSQGYLDVERVATAAKETACDVVHPGYGFLSENPALAHCLEDMGIAFAGPPASVLERLGDKAAARLTMEEAGVPVAPGFAEPEDGSWGSQEWAEVAGELGYPVMVKAVGGGGGRGIRRVDQETDLEDAVSVCRREALASFSDERLLVERCIEPARHIEVQIACGADGKAFHLYERECSLQRRHQKILEEAPAPGLAAQTVESLRSAAVRAAEATQYRGLGTVEFLVESDGESYCFMEMNPRLQVEHPVTESVAGVDLVEMQFRIVAGESVEPPPSVPSGHAIEVRLCAEDATEGFRPSPGRIHRLQLPRLPGLRIDCGVEPGDSISGAYDSLIAKFIAHGESRSAAISLLRRGLASMQVSGIDTNRGFLHGLLDTAPVREGRYFTSTLEEIADPIVQNYDHPPQEALAAVALHSHLSASPAACAPFDRVDGWRIQGYCKLSMILVDGSGERRVRLAARRDGSWRAYVDAANGSDSPPLMVTQLQFGQVLVEAQRVSRVYDVQQGSQNTFEVSGSEGIWRLRQPIIGEFDINDAADGSIRSPLPGRILRVHVTAGKRVARSDPLVTIEAMKTEHTLRAPEDGVVTRVMRQVDALVEEDEELVVLEVEGTSCANGR